MREATGAAQAGPRVKKRRPDAAMPVGPVRSAELLNEHGGLRLRASPSPRLVISTRPAGLFLVPSTVRFRRSRDASWCRRLIEAHTKENGPSLGEAEAAPGELSTTVGGQCRSMDGRRPALRSGAVVRLPSLRRKGSSTGLLRTQSRLGTAADQ
jgi:hypothetical protein